MMLQMEDIKMNKMLSLTSREKRDGRVSKSLPGSMTHTLRDSCGRKGGPGWDCQGRLLGGGNVDAES